MRRKFGILVFLMVIGWIVPCLLAQESQEPVYWVDPFIGTTAGLGNTFPGACVPFGMIQLSPDTTISNSSGYDSAHRTIEGFSCTHLSGTGCNDYGNILFMPIVGEIKILPGSEDKPEEGYRSRFDKKDEEALPGYYSVFLKDYNVKTELAVTKRAGFFRFTFPQTQESHILIDLYHRIGGHAIDGYVKIGDSITVEGYSYCNSAGGGWCGGSDYTVYFVAKFNKPFIGCGVGGISEPVDVPGKVLFSPNKKGSSQGLKGEYFNNRNLSGNPVFVRIDKQINFDWGGSSPDSRIPGDNFSVRWTGQLVPSVSGTYQIGFASDDGVRLFLNDELLIDKWVDRGTTTDLAPVSLEAGQVYNIRIEYYEYGGSAVARFVWAPYKVIKKSQCSITGKHLVGIVDYSTQKDEIILMKVGISFVSIEGARKNLEAEIPDWDFERVRNEAKESWNERLKKIRVEGGSDKQKTIFYTALYHTLIHPNIFIDVDGKYYGIDHRIHISTDTHYAIFSGWDVFRAEMPLLTLIEPVVDNEIIRSLICKYEQGGWLPIWEFANSYANCMIGDPAVPVIVDTYMKGLRDFDIEKAYEAMKKSALRLPPQGHPFRGRRGLEEYKRLGYIPEGTPGVWASVSTTLEYAYPDWCLAQIAKDLAREEDYKSFIRRACNWQNLFDSSAGFMRPKNRDGDWLSPFDPLQWEHGFCESNSWQQSWFVPHDVQGLIDLMGKEEFIEKLNTLFDRGLIHNFLGWGRNPYYYHGNEPDQHVVYLYNYLGMPWKTQYWVREIMEKAYGLGPDGLCGNDDCGQTSAWYIFSAIGFYPVCPGQNVYVLGSPIFDKVTIQLDKPYQGKTFVIEAVNVSEENKYIQSVSLNGKPLNRSWIKHSEIVNGGVLSFVMGPESNKKWGSSLENVPPSMSRMVK
ncbi:MAG: GH92 family glycosyl hydrolase [Elusimicrobia bacterium]|nr:GH92 family glycosyl hydrolase [Elusimicrobiota bacterium]